MVSKWNLDVIQACTLLANAGVIRRRPCTVYTIHCMPKSWGGQSAWLHWLHTEAWQHNKESSKPTKQMGCAKHEVLSMPNHQALDIRVHLCRLRGINEPRDSSMILPQPEVGTSVMRILVWFSFPTSRGPIQFFSSNAVNYEMGNGMWGFKILISSFPLPISHIPYQIFYFSHSTFSFNFADVWPPWH